MAVDARQVREWAETMAAAPNFQSEALDRLMNVKRELASATAEVDKAIEIFNTKTKVT